MNNEKPLNLHNIQKQSLINAVKEAEELGINITEILTEQMVQCLDLFKLGKTDAEIGLAVGLTRARVGQLLKGSSKSSLAIIRRHIKMKKIRPIPSRDEIISHIKSIEIDELYSAIERLKKPALMGIYHEIISGKQRGAK